MANRTAAELELARQRFYRRIWRETRFRTRAQAEAIARRWDRERLPPGFRPHRLLRILQGFTYHRRGDLTDLESAAEALTFRRGDCDSLALVYLALLDHWGIRGILMVSPRFGHALAALDVEGTGARFPFEGRGWLVAELTAPVALGLIDMGMADPRWWRGIALDQRP